MMQEEVRIPALNEKPSAKEILSAVPFVARFIFRSAPKSFLLWSGSAVSQIPLTSASIFVLKTLIDSLVKGDFVGALSWMWWLLGIYAFMGLNQYVMDYQTDVIRYRLEYATSEETIRVVSSLPFSVLERTEFRILSDAFQRKGYVLINMSQWTFWGVYYLATSLGLLAVLALIPLPAAVILLAAIVIRVLISKRESLWHWTLFDREKREGRRASYFRSILTFPFSLLPVKSWDLHEPFIKSWSKLTRGLLEASLKNLREISKTYAWTELMYIVSVGVALCFLIRDAKSGMIPVGSITAFLVAFPSFWSRIGSALTQYRMIRREAAFLVVVRDFLSLEPERDAGKSLPAAPLTIEFQNVHFSYPGSTEEVLRGITCLFREGSRFALVGLNGAGKSTMLKMLMGIFHPTKGRILVNGVNLAEIKPSAWRRALSVLGQDVPRFDDTLRNQIAYGDYAKRINRERLDMAVRSSGLGDVLSEFKRGLETHAGKQYAMTEDEPIELSGGQNQIVGIARTMYRDARMYVFDEPTSAVDPEKEETFFRSLPDVLSGKGVIFVSHRFSTLRQAEHIIVIDQGRVIEEGSHEELMAKKGRYAELFTLQARAYQ